MSFSSKYSKLSSGDAALNYNSIFNYTSGGRRQTWAKRSQAEGRDYLKGEDEEWKSSDNFCDVAVNWFIIFFCYVLVAFSFPFSLLFCLKIVSNYETLVIFRLGKLQRPKGPGPTILLPCIDQCHRIDLRMRAFSVPPQTVLLRDGSGVEIGADVYFRTCDPLKATLGVQSLDASVRALAKTTVINACTSLSLNDLTTDTQVLGSKLQKVLNETCVDWGCEVGQVVLSKPKVIQEPREESRHPGFNQLSQLLSGFTKGDGGGGGGGGVEAIGGGMGAILQHLAPQLAASTANRAVSNDAAAGGGAASQAAAPPSTFQPEITAGSESAVAIAGAAAALPAESLPAESTNPIEELAHLFLGVLSGVLTEKLVRSINCAYEVTLENLDGVGEDRLLFYLDLKHGLGSVGKGCLPNRRPDARISLPASRFPALLQGQLSVFHAYMCGDLKVEGDTSAALKLEEIMTLMMHQIGESGYGKN